MLNSVMNQYLSGLQGKAFYGKTTLVWKGGNIVEIHTDQVSIKAEDVIKVAK